MTLRDPNIYVSDLIFSGGSDTDGGSDDEGDRGLAGTRSSIASSSLDDSIIIVSSVDRDSPAGSSLRVLLILLQIGVSYQRLGRGGDGRGEDGGRRQRLSWPKEAGGGGFRRLQPMVSRWCAAVCDDDDGGRQDGRR
ncbi:hypothetical protein Tco_0260779 [Tanacetum coccineum]